MTGFKTLRTIPIAVICLLALGTAAAFAQRLLHNSNIARPEIKVSLGGTLEQGDERIALDKAAPVKPGEILDWTITSENAGSTPALDYKAVGQIPRGTQLVAGSANADGSATVVYSIDNGKSFSTQPMVDEKQPDGTIKKVPAPISTYTNLRYEWSDPLSQGGKRMASYKVRVN